MPVGLTISDGVATITLQTPENRNALSVRLRRALAVALDSALANPSVDVIELTGAGPVFCAGADLKEGPAEGPGIPSLVSILTRIMDAPKPVVAVLNGPARAGGIGLVAACDLAIAPDTVTFAFSEVRIGVIPAVISVPCLRVMDPRAVTRYFLTGEVFDAAAAVTAGLLTAAVAASEVVALRDSVVAGLREGAPAALAGTKRLLREIPGLPRETAFAYAERVSAVFFASADADEGRASFGQRRPPAWSPRAAP